MNAYRLKATLGENGTPTLEGLPFSSGDLVEVIVLETNILRSTADPKNSERPSDEPLGFDYLSAVSSTMTEWASDADELAYRDL